MPRSSRNSQAAMASAIVPDESLRTFYTFNPDAITPSSSNNNDNDDDNSNNPMWTRRRGGGTTTTTTTRRTSGRASTSNMTDISVSSASLNSPIQSSSQAASEASSYTTRAIPGVIDEQDEQQQRDISEDHESDDDDDESDEVVVVARLSTLTANRGRRRVVPRVSNEDTPDGDSIQADNNDIHSGNHNHHSHNSNGEEEGDGGENGESSGISTSHFSSRLLDESEDDDLTNGTNGGRSHYMNNGDNDSLVDASPEEVEARAKEIIGWDNVGQDKDLYMVDLERWNTISEKHSTPGTAEYRKSIKVFTTQFSLADY